MFSSLPLHWKDHSKKHKQKHAFPMVFLFGNPPASVFSQLTAKDPPALSSNPGFSNPHVPVLLGRKRSLTSRSATLTPRPSPLSHDPGATSTGVLHISVDGSSRFPSPSAPKSEQAFGEAALPYLVPVRLHIHRPLVSVTILLSLLPKIPRDVAVHDRLHDGNALKKGAQADRARSEALPYRAAPRGPRPAAAAEAAPSPCRRSQARTLPFS